MNDRLALIGFVLLLVGLLALIVTGAVREVIVIPLLALLWLLGLLLDASKRIKGDEMEKSRLTAIGAEAFGNDGE